MQCDILSIAWAFGARSESWLYGQIAHLRHHRVHVLTYEYLNRDEYPHSPVTLLPPRNSFAARLERLPAYLRGHRYPLRLHRRDKRVFHDIMRKDATRLVQAHFGWVGNQVAGEVERYRLPFVVWLYGSDVFRAQRPTDRSVTDLFGTSAVFCCTSEALRREMVGSGCARHRINVIYPGVEVPPEPPRRQPRSGEPVRLLSVGRLCDFKKPDTLVQLAGILHDRGVAFTWEYLGGGELCASLEEAVRDAGLGGNFRLLGEVPHADVLERMRSADILIHNAVVAPDGGRESFGVVLAEASAAALPIVSARVGGIPEVVRDGETGYLVEEGDIEGMAAKVAALAREFELRRRLGETAHTHAMENFEAAKQTEKLDAFYDGLLERHTRE